MDFSDLLETFYDEKKSVEANIKLHTEGSEDAEANQQTSNASHADVLAMPTSSSAFFSLSPSPLFRLGLFTSQP